MGRIGVIGGGAFGTAMACAVRRSGHEVVLWALEPEVVAEINGQRRNTHFLPGVPLPEGIRATNDIAAAINAGGSTLRDYVGSDGRAGYFQNQFLVYGRAGEPCLNCGAIIRELRQAQRATCYCPACQKR